MKTFATRILTLTLILSLSFFQTGFVFAEETVTESTTTPEETVVPEPETTLATIPEPEANESEELELASSTPLVFAPATTTDPASVMVTNDNEATTTNDVAADAQTGDNTASTTGSATIDTGDALANANVMNVVNVNMFNSEALFLFLNRLGSQGGSIDLRDILSGYDGNLGCADCSLTSSSIPTTVSSTSTNDATINNAVIVRSGSGNNTASSTDDASITTGNAYANANVVNVANTNFTDSRYVMIMFNSFGSLHGDIVLPNASFFDSFLAQPQTTNNNSTSPTSVTTDNDAVIGNEVSTDAHTGDNTAHASSTDGTIQTGNALSGSTIINQANQNYIGGNGIALMFRVYGNWSGKMFNVPSGLMWNGTPVSIQFYSESGAPLGANGGSIASDNNATLQNNVSVAASTGGNNAAGNGASIKTGNAYANANIVNIANTNIVGRNWINAIINIFGDWNGNISFGQPDLWVGTRASFKNNYTGPGAEIEFNYTIKNNGDAPAHNVSLDHTFGSQYIGINGSNGSWDIGDLAPGQTKELTSVALASQTIPFGDTAVSNTITVKANETDSNPQNNTDGLNVVLSYYSGVTNINHEPVLDGVPANFTITKSHTSPAVISASSTVDYTINIKNVGGKADHALLIDEIKNESGEVVHKEEWDLGAVQSQEVITVTYTASFNTSTTPGMYTNNAQIKTVTGKFPDSSIASSTITIGTLLTAPLSKVERPFQHLPLPVTEARTQDVHLEEVATSTASTTPLALTTDIFDGANTGRVAGAFAALGGQSWYWYLLIVSGAGYLALQQRRIT